MKAYILVLSLLALTGCSREPNEKQITEAVKISVQESNEAIKANVTQMNEMTKSVDNIMKDVDSIVKENIDNTHLGINIANQSFEEMSKPLLFKVLDVQKLGQCVSQEKKGVTRCLVKMTTENNGRKLSQTLDVNFIQTEKGDWIVYDNEDDNAK